MSAPSRPSQNEAAPGYTAGASASSASASSAPTPNGVGAAPSAAAPSAAAPPIEEVSVGELIANISRDMSTLMRQEVELAKAEIKTEVSKTAKGAGMLGGAGFAGYMTALFLSMAAGWGLANVMDAGWAFLIVTLLWAVVALVLFTMGRKTMRTVNPKPERTVETVKQVPDALKPGN